MLRDLRLAVRPFLGRRGQTALAVSIIALGIAGSTVTFSVLDAVLLRPLPYREPHDLVQAFVRSGDEYGAPYVLPDAVKSWRTHPELFAAVETFRVRNPTLTGHGATAQLPGAEVSGGLFGMLGVNARRGRTILPVDEEARAPLVVVLSDALWRGQFGADTGIIGQHVRLDGASHEIVGVMPPGFGFPYSPQRLWTVIKKPVSGTVQAVMRLAPGVTPERGGVGATALASAAPLPAGVTTHDRVHLRPLDEHGDARTKRMLQVLMAAVTAMVLLICANVSMMLLADAATREHETAVRAALGASCGRLVRESLLGTALLTSVGAIVGIGLASVALRVISHLLPTALLFFSIEGLQLDWRVLLFAATLSAITALAAGLLPAVRSSRAGPVSVGSGTRSATRRRGARLWRGGFVAAQVALSLVLVISAGLLARTLSTLVSIPRGFETSHLVRVDLGVPAWKYKTGAARWQMLSLLADRVRELPGVREATLTGGIPPSGGGFHFDVHLEVEGRGALPADPGLEIPFSEVEPAFFGVLGIPLQAGRTFDDSDAHSRENPVIVSASLARRLRPNGSAVGARWRIDHDAPWLTVVGVVGDVYQLDYAAPHRRDAFYRPLGPSEGVAMLETLVVRTVAEPIPLVPSIRHAVWSVDPEQPIQRIATVEADYAEFFAKPRFITQLVGSFALLAVLIGALGTYGAVGQTVAERHREFGIRIALGARRTHVGLLTMRTAGAMVLSGTGAGLILAFWTTRFMESLLVDVPTLDVPAFVAGLGAVATLSVLACVAPVWRATRAEPASLLRAE